MSRRWVRALSTTVLVACAVPLLVVQPARATPPGARESVSEVPEGCAAGLRSDFNGDGYSDAVVANPYASLGSFAEVGRIAVLYGDSDGRIGEGARDSLVQGDRSVGGNSEPGDRFGFAMAAADLDCDDFTDLVVGIPYKDNGGQVDSGSVRVIWGAATGLGTGRVSVEYTQADFGQPVRAHDQFGYAVDALEDVVLGGESEPRAPLAYVLAIGVPGGDVGSDDDAGWVGIVDPGFPVPTFRVVTQDSRGIPGVTEPGDRFGASVALFSCPQSKYRGFAIGSPNEDVGDVVDAGTVTISGLRLSQNSPGVASVPEEGDRFGYSLDSTRIGNITRLAVGVPYEDIGSAASAGMVQLFSGNCNPLTAGVALTQDTDGVADESETGDLFGQRVAWARPGQGDTVSRLAVSAPSEDGAADNTGLVQVFPMTNLGAELTYSQSSPGIPGNPTAGDRFGSSLAVVSGIAERALLAGVPDDVEFSTGMVDVIPFGGGTARSWRPGSGGILGGPTIHRFGDSVANGG